MQDASNGLSRYRDACRGYRLRLAEPLGQAQQVVLTKEAYVLPPKEIADVVLAPRHENVSLTNLCPDGRKFLITKSDGMPTLVRMGRPAVHLGEMDFDPVAGRARQLWIRSDRGYDLFSTREANCSRAGS